MLINDIKYTKGSILVIRNEQFPTFGLVEKIYYKTETKGNQAKDFTIIVSVLEMVHYDDHLQSYVIRDPIETAVLDLDKIYNNNLWYLVQMPDDFTYILCYNL